MFRYDHQERLTAMEAMEHAYFFPVIKVYTYLLAVKQYFNIFLRTTPPGYPR